MGGFGDGVDKAPGRQVIPCDILPQNSFAFFFGQLKPLGDFLHRFFRRFHHRALSGDLQPVQDGRKAAAVCGSANNIAVFKPDIAVAWKFGEVFDAFTKVNPPHCRSVRLGHDKAVRADQPVDERPGGKTAHADFRVCQHDAVADRIAGFHVALGGLEHKRDMQVCLRQERFVQLRVRKLRKQREQRAEECVIVQDAVIRRQDGAAALSHRPDESFFVGASEESVQVLVEQPGFFDSQFFCVAVGDFKARCKLRTGGVVQGVGFAEASGNIEIRDAVFCCRAETA